MTHTLTLTIPDALWMSSNGRIHHHDRARRTRAVRQLAADAARASSLPFFGQVHVGVFVGYSSKRRADPANSYPTVKACLDGITDSGGVWADDDSEHVVALSFMRDPKRAERGTHTLRLVFTDQELPWMTPEEPTGCPCVSRLEHNGHAVSGGTNAAQEANTSRRSVRKGKGA